MNFWDRLGRLHTKEVTEGDLYPTNNAYIYTAYYKILHRLQLKQVLNMQLPTTMPFSRHPDQAAPPISHDEITGVCILNKVLATMICDYLKENHNQFCDLPGFVSKPLWKLNPFKVLAAFRALKKEENTRKTIVKHPDTWNLAFWQRPEYRWFYKRAAGLTPSLWEKTYFLIARFVTVFKWKLEDPNLLLYFSLKHLKQQGNLGIEGHIIQMYMNTYVNDIYEDELHMLRFATKDLPEQYFWQHPWITG